MEKGKIIGELRGATIAEITLDESENPPFRIATLLTTNGYLFDFATGEKTHPAYDKDKAAFMEKLEAAKPDSFFMFRTNELSHDEMRQAAQDHAKKINANGGNVSGHFNGEYKVTFGEDLDTLK